MGILDRLMSKAKSAKDAANRSELRRNPAEGDEEREAKEMLTGKITLDSINLGEIMPESSLKHIFMEESTMTKLGECFMLNVVNLISVTG
ncbi:hypothetical protein EB796_020279 [Bugula neritina]|uniref:Uncharacterized protein n=1 Tax=Bugula neritina TaxID=10212 RepID=A0A7J7J5I1_BUGNE|nr:hypothetical protein EB796_020279 [Bugula neritina]